MFSSSSYLRVERCLYGHRKAAGRVFARDRAAVMLRRSITASGVMALTLLAAGCHKKTHQSYSPPPPPGISHASNESGRKSAGVPPASAGVAKPLPVPDSVRGKPISTEVGMASWYGPPYAGRRGADGAVYDQNAMTAAHLTLPMGTLVRVTNLTNNQSVVVRITDRGPFVHGRIIDLSLAAAKATGRVSGRSGEGAGRGLCRSAEAECDSGWTMVRADRGVPQSGGCDLVEERSAAAIYDCEGD
jgi:hypothetical protein